LVTRLVRVMLSVLALASGAALAIEYPAVKPGQLLSFPRDHGAHPDYRTEWWYITGWVNAESDRPLGVQITFFRSRTGIGENNASPFAARQLLFAHVAIADPRAGKLIHDQRAGRVGFGIVGAATATTNVWIDDWSLVLAGDRYVARIKAKEFAIDLSFAPTQPILLQGDAGFSRKGPRPGQASYYYSQPQLKIEGRMTDRGAPLQVTGSAWLDHEWSSEIMDESAQGWDWVGLNLTDGTAVMAFQMRKTGGEVLWSAGTRRVANGNAQAISAREVRFVPQRQWRSARSGAQYPVAMRIHVGAESYDLEPLFDDQELDARTSVGTIYWEGAVRVMQNGQLVGRGYLELTGYWRRLRF
jgi:predicted secreted hydrolase